jgi:hypothetical protein
MQTRQGDRPAFSGTPGTTFTPAGSQTGFNVTRNTSGARLSGYTFHDFKTVVRQESASASASDIQVGTPTAPVIATNVFSFWDTAQGNNAQPTLGAKLTNFDVRGIEKSLLNWWAVRGTSANWVEVSNGYADGGGNIGDPYQETIALRGGCSYVWIHDVTLRNAFGGTGGSSTYYNGDLIADEGANDHILYGNLDLANAGDSLFDVKSSPTAYGYNLLVNAHRPMRIWNSLTDGAGMTLPDGSTAPAVTVWDIRDCSGQCIWMNGLNPNVGGISVMPVAVIGKLIARNPTSDADSISRFENGPADLTILDYDIEKGWRGKLLHFNGGSGYGAPKYPNGGRVQQDDGSWITYAGAPPTGTGGVIL